MFVINAITSLLALFLLVQASPLSYRDVIAPKITSPTASSVWTVGSVETVTWDTSDFPPDNQITNPIGKVILGHEENGSLNLDFAHPLASDFKLRDGSVKITVPDVPPRDDYLIVLFGDSGNTSPSFVIAKISNGGGSSSPLLPPTSSTLISTPVPITGSTITGGVSTTTSGSSPSSTSISGAAVPTSTTPTSSASASGSGSTTGSAAASNQTQNSAAMSVVGNSWSLKVLTACMTLSALFVLV